MPAWRLDGVAIHVRTYDIASLDSGAVGQFVGHVGLSNESEKEIGGESDLPMVSMVHMMPPLTGNRHLWPISAVGTANLTPDEVLQIKLACQHHSSEYEAKKVRKDEQYIICPCVKSPDPNRPYHRFSCAGFVIVAYRWAGIELIATNEQELPKVSLPTLKQAYPFYAEKLDDPVTRVEFGLEATAEEWPVVLAGYVMNALDRDANDIRNEPYQPVAGDEFFPRTAAS